MLRIGHSQVRYEDDALVRGQGRFTDDLHVSNALCMVMVRSPVAAGRITRLDTARAKGMPGVRAVLVGTDLSGTGHFVPRVQHPGPDAGQMRIPPFPPLARDAVRHVGDPVAAVLAESRVQAEDAAEAVILETEVRDVVVDALAASAPDARRVWEHFPDNLCFRVDKGDAAAVARASASAARVVRHRLHISRVTAAPMEPRAALASYDAHEGRFRLELGTQTPNRMIADLAPVLAVEPAALRIVSHACGGSFGMKNSAFPEYVVALWAARALGRPVHWLAGRVESFLGDTHARDLWADAELALDADGHFLAFDVHIAANLGAYLGPATPLPPVVNLGGLAGVYRTPTIHACVEGYFTNTQSTAPYRGAGRPEATYILERMIDLAARDSGIDPAELRRRNLIMPEQMPFRTGLVFTYDSGDFPAVMDRALAAADWNGFPRRRTEAEARGRLRGIAVVNPIEIAGGPAESPLHESARLILSPSGRVQIAMGSSDAGQGHLTAFRQILCDRLDLAAEDVALSSGDSDTLPDGTGTFGSRTMATGGTALWRATDKAIETLRDTAAMLLEAAAGEVEFADGKYRIAGTNQALPFSSVLTQLKTAITVESSEPPKDATFPNGCHVCEVEIDPETGKTDLVRYTVVDDVGTVINPLLMKGQIVGGVAQGVGQALLEQIVHDPETGQLLTASFMDYAMPRATDMPRLNVESHPVPTLNNPLGAKGAGEAGTVGALPAVMNAVCDALASAGAGPLDMPATAPRVWQALRAVRG
jgi:aerobic carbon-monoxide dehydrogenase large subunit